MPLLNPDSSTDIEVPLAEHLSGVHVVHYVGVDGKDIRVCVCFTSDDEVGVTVGYTEGVTVLTSTIEYVES